jgi:hypothetical protein
VNPNAFARDTASKPVGWVVALSGGLIFLLFCVNVARGNCQTSWRVYANKAACFISARIVHHCFKLSSRASFKRVPQNCGDLTI